MPFSINSLTSHESVETPELEAHIPLFLSQNFHAASAGGLQQPGGGELKSSSTLWRFNALSSTLYVVVIAVPELLPIMPN